MLSGLQILQILTNEPEDVAKLLHNHEFIHNFFILCFGSKKQDFTFSKTLLYCLFGLLYYKSFRDGILATLQDEGEENNYAKLLKNHASFEFIIPDEKKSSGNHKRRVDSPDEEEERMEKKKQQENIKKKEKKANDDDWNSSSEEEQEEKDLNEVLNGLTQQVTMVGKQSITGRQIQLKSVYHLLVKQMLCFSNSPTQFSILKDCNLLLGFVEYIRKVKQIAKSFAGFSEKIHLSSSKTDPNNGPSKPEKYLTDLDYVDSLENLNLFLRKIEQTLRSLINKNLKKYSKIQSSKEST